MFPTVLVLARAKQALHFSLEKLIKSEAETEENSASTTNLIFNTFLRGFVSNAINSSWTKLWLPFETLSPYNPYMHSVQPRIARKNVDNWIIRPRLNGWVHLFPEYYTWFTSNKKILQKSREHSRCSPKRLWKKAGLQIGTNFSKFSLT